MSQAVAGVHATYRRAPFSHSPALLSAGCAPASTLVHRSTASKSTPALHTWSRRCPTSTIAVTDRTIHRGRAGGLCCYGRTGPGQLARHSCWDGLLYIVAHASDAHISVHFIISIFTVDGALRLFSGVLGLVGLPH